jgi:PAS domain S-box-containing protein
MHNLIIEDIVQLHLAFAGVFFFLNWQDPNRFARLFAWSWVIEAARAAILLPEVHGLGGFPDYWYSAAEILCVPATWCLVAGIADMAGARLPRRLGTVYLWSSTVLLLLIRFAGQDIAVRSFGVDPARANAGAVFANQLVLFIPVTIGRLAILAWIFGLWRKFRIPGALVAAAFAVPYAVLAVLAPLDNYLGYDAGWVTSVWFGRVLGFSVGLVVLMLNFKQAAAAASESAMAAAQELAQLGSWELDLRSMTGTWSREMCRLHGRDPALGAPPFAAFLDLVHPEDRQKIIEAQSRVPGALAAIELEYRTSPAAGPPRHISVKMHMTRDEARAPRKLVGNSLDITARKEAALALQESEERYRTIFENAVEGIFRTTPEGGLLAANPAAARIFGYGTPEEMLQERTDLALQGYVDPSRREDFKRQIETSGTVQGFEYLARRRDGSEVFVSENARAVRGRDGKTLYYDGTIIDLSERRQAEEALRQTRRQLERVIGISPTVVYSLSVDGESFIPTYFSENLRSLLGYRPQEAMTPDWWITNLHASDRDHVVANVPSLFAKGHAALDYRFRDKGGTYRWLRDEQRCVKGPGGRPVEVIGSWTDVTERVNLESQLRQAQKMEAVGQLAGGVAHDFNNLLTVIKGYSQLVVTDDLPTSEARELSREIFAAATRAGQLTNQLLAFSRKHAIHLRTVDLNETVLELAKMLERLIGASVSLEFDCAPDTPRVRADTGMLEQVLMNLAINARDAMPGGGSIVISTGSRAVSQGARVPTSGAYPGKFATLRVADTGTGIPADVLAHIFEPFYTTKAPGKGTGLGLATAYGIVQQHKGWIDVKTEIGRGSAFTVYIPALAGSEPSPAGQQGPDRPARGTETILLVEDEAAVRQLARLVLQRLGYRVLEAASGPAAMAVWRENPAHIDLLLTDVILPGGPSGFQVAQALLAERPDLAVVYMSGFVGPAEKHGPELTAGLNFLPKPYLPTALALIVRGRLDARTQG